MDKVRLRSLQLGNAAKVFAEMEESIEGVPWVVKQEAVIALEQAARDFVAAETEKKALVAADEKAAAAKKEPKAKRTYKKRQKANGTGISAEAQDVFLTGLGTENGGANA